MRILLTNIWLKTRSGTEVVTMEMATGLAQRGHDVVVFSPDLGASADALRSSGGRVTDRLDELDFAPDVIHGNHSIDLAHGLMRFRKVPGVFVCHNSDHWICSPPDLSQIRAYVAVDRLGRERIAADLPRVRDSIRIIHNAVDLARYRRRDALPVRPLKALALTKFSEHLPTLQESGRKIGLEIDALGPGVDVVVDHLADRLKRYDLVFGTARMALEAMAVGCAVIVVDARGLAGLVTSQTVGVWRDDNYGKRILTRPVSVQAIVDEIARYDAADAALVTDDIRAHHALDRILLQYEAVYREAIEAGATIDENVSAREWSRMMRSWLPLMNGIPPVSFDEVDGRIQWLSNELAARARDVAWRDDELTRRVRDIEWRDKELAARDRDIEWRDQEIAARDATLNSPAALARRLVGTIARRLRK